MDPNATLAEIREGLVGWYQRGSGMALEDVASATESLIEWLDKGGALPTCWQRQEESF